MSRARGRPLKRTRPTDEFRVPSVDEYLENSIIWNAHIDALKGVAERAADVQHERQAKREQDKIGSETSVARIQRAHDKDQWQAEDIKVETAADIGCLSEICPYSHGPLSDRRTADLCNTRYRLKGMQHMFICDRCFEYLQNTAEEPKVQLYITKLR